VPNLLVSHHEDQLYSLLGNLLVSQLLSRVEGLRDSLPGSHWLSHRLNHHDNQVFSLVDSPVVNHLASPREFPVLSLLDNHFDVLRLSRLGLQQDNLLGNQVDNRLPSQASVLLPNLLLNPPDNPHGSPRDSLYHHHLRNQVLLHH
jgi:hypothetical protein